jgi:hypothetical protein
MLDRELFLGLGLVCKCVYTLWVLAVIVVAGACGEGCADKVYGAVASALLRGFGARARRRGWRCSCVCAGGLEIN